MFVQNDASAELSTMIAWITGLFFLPAAVILVIAVGQLRRRGGHGLGGALGALGWSAIGVLVLAGGLALADGFWTLASEGLATGGALIAWGAGSTYLAAAVLGSVQPKWAAVALVCSLVPAVFVLIAGASFLAPLDPNTDPLRPTTEAASLSAIAIALMYPTPALIAALLFAGSARRRGGPSRAASQLFVPRGPQHGW